MSTSKNLLSSNTKDMTDIKHTDRSNLGQIEKKFDLLSTETQHTDSVEARSAAIHLTATLDREVFKGQYSSSGLEAIEAVVARELATLQAQTSQQVEEAVRKLPRCDCGLSRAFTPNYQDDEEDKATERAEMEEKSDIEMMEQDNSNHQD